MFSFCGQSCAVHVGRSSWSGVRPGLGDGHAGIAGYRFAERARHHGVWGTLHVENVARLCPTLAGATESGAPPGLSVAAPGRAERNDVGRPGGCTEW